MKKAGITGNIGSGKTTVCKIFEILGVPVFHADEAGRELLEQPFIINKIVDVFGKGVLHDDQTINRRTIAGIVFADEEKLKSLNNIIHPEVRNLFIEWMDKFQNQPYVLYEAAILFESGHYKNMDYMITVSAAEALRIDRVMQRDNISRNEVLRRIENQWPEEKITALSAFVIINDDVQMVIPQVLEIHSKLSL